MTDRMSPEYQREVSGFAGRGFINAPEMLDDRDFEIYTNRVEKRDNIVGPRVGDFLLKDATVWRFSHDWGPKIQYSKGGSFHLNENGGVSFSGGLEPAIKKLSLKITGEIRCGVVWFFHHGHYKAHNGIDVLSPCRVFEYTTKGTNTMNYKHIAVNLTGVDGNAFSIIVRCINEMKKAGVGAHDRQVFMEEAMTGEYDNVLRTARKWFTVN